eukprot:COSAG02_NODE_23428_length_719_cov_0.882258_1_plen_64_part_01
MARLLAYGLATCTASTTVKWGCGAYGGGAEARSTGSGCGGISTAGLPTQHFLRTYIVQQRPAAH